jgi:hypothetical protein
MKHCPVYAIPKLLCLKQLMVNVRELFDAEKLLHNILMDEKHPAFNQNHPSHAACKRAFVALNQKILAARIELGAQERFR